MRKLTTLINVMVLAAVFFLAGTTSSMAGGKVRGIVSIFSGTYQQFFPLAPPGTTSGPFMCLRDEGLIIATVVFYFSEGICDDVQPNSAGLPTCGGRFTSRVEECSDFGRDLKIDGGPSSVVSVNSRGQTELCFASAASPASPADCWSAGGTPGMVYATGTTLSVTRLIPGLTSPVLVTGETTLTSSTKFRDGNGIKVDAKMFDGAISHLTVEPNDSPPACGFTPSSPGSPGSPGFGPVSGCGLAGVFVKGKK